MGLTEWQAGRDLLSHVTAEISILIVHFTSIPSSSSATVLVNPGLLNFPRLSHFPFLSPVVQVYTPAFFEMHSAITLLSLATQ